MAIWSRGAQEREQGSPNPFSFAPSIALLDTLLRCECFRFSFSSLRPRPKVDRVVEGIRARSSFSGLRAPRSQSVAVTEGMKRPSRRCPSLLVSNMRLVTPGWRLATWGH